MDQLIWVYTVTESNELQARDVDSLRQLESISEEANWLWVDMMEPNDEEYQVVSGLIGEAKEIEQIKEQKTFSRPVRVNDYFLISIPRVMYKNELETSAIYVLLKQKTFLTIRKNHFSKSVKNVLRTFEDCVGKLCEGSANSAFILSRLFHEISNENLDVVMALGESIDKTEQSALVSPADKKISHSVFATKREISTLERVLWTQRELLLSIEEGVVPMIQIPEEIRTTLNHPVSNISRELSLLDSHNNALDSILSLQDLGMIHKVERKLIYLTIMALLVSVFLILLEIDIITLLS